MKKVFLGKAFQGQYVGIKEVDDKIWKVIFMNYDLGNFDEIDYSFTENENPFIKKLLPMSPV